MTGVSQEQLTEQLRLAGADASSDRSIAGMDRETAIEQAARMLATLSPAAFDKLALRAGVMVLREKVRGRT